MKRITFKARTSDSRFITLSTGNKKLKSNKNTRFLIWNIPAITTCPFATPNCKKLCYAIKSERCYPSARISRTRNLEKSMANDFVESMIYTIESYLDYKPNYKACNKVVFRIHESGDFYSQEYFNKWVEIANTINNKYGDKVVLMAYTKSVKYVNNCDMAIPSNMVIRYSLWNDSNAQDVALANVLGLPTYTAVESFDGYKGCKCRCEDCATCGLCWNVNAKMIACEIH